MHMQNQRFSAWNCIIRNYMAKSNCYREASLMSLIVISLPRHNCFNWYEFPIFSGSLLSSPTLSGTFWVLPWKSFLDCQDLLWLLLRWLLCHCSFLLHQTVVLLLLAWLNNLNSVTGLITLKFSAKWKFIWMLWSPTQCWVIQQISFINTFPWILESLLMKFPLLEVKLNESYCHPWNGKYLDPQKFRIQFLTFWKWKASRQLFCASLEILRASEACFMKRISVSHKIRFSRYTTKSLVTSNIVCNHFLTPCHRVSFFLLFLLLLNNSSSSTARVLKLLPSSWWSSSMMASKYLIV